MGGPSIRSLLFATAFAACTAYAPAAAEDSEPPARIERFAWRGDVSGNKVSTVTSQVITVFGPAGAGYARISLVESPYINIKSVMVKVRNSQGKLLYTRKKGDMLKACGFGDGSQFYSDQCYYDLTLPSPQYPYTVESELRVERLSLFFLPDISLQFEIPVKQASIELTYPAARPVRYRLYGLDSQPTFQQSGETHKVTWLINDIPPLSDVSHWPPESRVGARLVFAAERFELGRYRFDGLTWKNVGLWYKDLSEERNSSGGSLGPAAQPSTRQAVIADSLYLETTRGLRYVSVTIDLSGWQPHPTATTEARGFGDCKDLTAV